MCEVVVAAQALGREVGLVIGGDDPAVVVDEPLVRVGDADRRVGGEGRQYPLDGVVSELVVVVEERHDVARRHGQRPVRRRHDPGVLVGDGDEHPRVGRRQGPQPAADNGLGRGVVDDAPLPAIRRLTTTDAMHASKAASGGSWTGVSMLRRDPDRLGWTTAPT